MPDEHWGNFNFPLFGLGVTYVTNGRNADYLTTVSLYGFRFGLGVGKQQSYGSQTIYLFGYSFTIKRMIFYVDAHYFIHWNGDIHNIYRSPTTFIDKFGVNFGVGFCF